MARRPAFSLVLISIFLTAIFVIPLQAAADEKILSMESNITIHKDGSMTVVETITVRAEGNQIKRGIYRDFPTRYMDRYGNIYRTTFNALDVKPDGGAEDFHTKTLENGTRLYLGNRNRYLKPGVYTYTITYRTDRQLGFYKDYDELYWNVTGNGWVFPIEKAAARVTLPIWT